MVVKVKLEGLNIVRARGRFYVYIRGTKEKLLGGFDGTRDELMKRLAMPDMIAKYNARRVRDLTRIYPEGTLGAIVQWFETECPKYQTLSEATKRSYSTAFRYLKPEFDFPVNEISQADIYDIRDRCAREKWPRFADNMVAALSSMFSQASRRGKIAMNPAKGLDKAHKPSKQANREWMADEVKAAITAAPDHIKRILFLARYAGFRGQTIATLTWREYQDDPSYGKCFRTVTRKNGEILWVPAAIELQEYLKGCARTALTIATKANGSPWDNEVQMQTEVSHFLRKLEKEGTIGAKTTLHGLRVTYAADLRRSGADAGQVAAALGDKSERMGTHYTRHVENEAKVIQAFKANFKGKKKR